MSVGDVGKEHRRTIKIQFSDCTPLTKLSKLKSKTGPKLKISISVKAQTHVQGNKPSAK